MKGGIAPNSLRGIDQDEQLASYVQVPKYQRAEAGEPIKSSFPPPTSISTYVKQWASHELHCETRWL